MNNHITMNCYKETSPYIIPADYPDLDVIRVDDTFFMVSTTMHFFPGCVILKSYNLIDWEFACYVFEKLDETPAQKLDDNHGIYGKGMWAASLRFFDGVFYVCFVCNDTQKTYLFKTSNIYEKWNKSEIKGFYHDMSLLFEKDEEGETHIFCVYGNTEIHLVEFDKELKGIKKDGINKIIIKDDKKSVILGYEGSHFYKINGKYYVFLIHIPNGKMRTQSCFVSDKIDGEYQGGDILCCDVENWNSGVAQGGIVQNTDGKFYSILFQDHGALGRIPVLISLDFLDDKPIYQTILGEKRNISLSQKIQILDNKPDYQYSSLFSDDFTHSCWQFNHQPKKKSKNGDFLFLLKKNSFILKTDKLVKNVTQAINTLTRRTFGELCESEFFVDASKINEGDFTGICAFEGNYGFLAITKQKEEFFLVLTEHKSNNSPYKMGVFDEEEATIIQKKKILNPQIFIKLVFDLTKEKQIVNFLYKNSNNENYVDFGDEIKLEYRLDHFVGVRTALFCYSTKMIGGQVEFKNSL